MDGGCIGGGPAGVDPHVAANAPTQTLQLLQKRSDEGLKSCVIRAGGGEHAHAPHALALLRANGKRPPGRRAAKKRDEFAPSHCLTQARDKASYRLKLAHFKGPQPMSALGQKQIFAVRPGMSVVPPNAEMCGANGNVRSGPIGDIARTWRMCEPS